MPEYHQGDLVDGWILERWLGHGGNAQVWLASRDGQTVALKVLKGSNTKSEPFRRFKTEIEVLRRIGDRPGILPLLDASLPERPSRPTPAWLAMPVAMLVREKLGDEPGVDETIRCHWSFAVTLAELQDKYQLFHRDIKPQNLYFFNDQWCLGDFGLVEYPDKASLTAPGKWVGAVNYLAPEMLIAPDNAEPGPVDVYALAKTLWTILARTQVPIPGPLDRRLEACRLTSYVRDDRLNSVELLLDRATRHEPGARPTMQAFADELGAWGKPALDRGAAFDPQALRGIVSPNVSQHISTHEALHRLWTEGLSILTGVKERLTPLQQSLLDALGIPVGLEVDGRVSNVPGMRAWFREKDHRTYQGVSLWVEGKQPFGGGQAVELFGGLAIFLTSNPERISLAAGYALNPGDGSTRELWYEGKSVTPGSALAGSFVEELLQGLFSNAELAVRAFADALPL